MKKGLIDKKFATLVNRSTCAKIAINLNLKKFIKTGTSFKNLKSSDEKILVTPAKPLLELFF